MNPMDQSIRLPQLLQHLQGHPDHRHCFFRLMEEDGSWAPYHFIYESQFQRIALPIGADTWRYWTVEEFMEEFERDYWIPFGNPQTE